MKKKFLILWLIFVLSILTVPNIFSQEFPLKDVGIEIILPDIVNYLEIYTQPFLLTNYDDEVGVEDNLSVYVSYRNFSINKTINHYSKTGMGFVSFNASEELCVMIKAINYIDFNSENNFVCKNISIYYDNSTENISINNTQEINQTNSSKNNYTNESVCNHFFKISSDKDIYEKGEQIKFQIYLDNYSGKFPYEITYWIEDVFGNVAKNNVTTTSKSEKTYTPNFSGSEKVFVLKAKSNNCSLNTSKIIVFKEFQEQRETNYEIITTSDMNSRLILAEINGYKGDSDKTLISFWVEKNGKKVSEISKVYIYSKNSDFKNKLPVLLKDKQNFEGEYLFVAEGLDERIEKTLEINFPYEKEECEKEIEFVQKKFIKNVYTRKIKYDKTINIYISLSDEAFSSYYLDVFSSEENKSIYLKENLSSPINVQMNISSPNEHLVVEIKNDKFELLETKALHLNLEKEEPQKEEPLMKNSTLTHKVAVLNKEIDTSQIQSVIKNSTNFEEISLPKTDNSLLIFSLTAIIGSVFIFKKDFFKKFIKKTKIFK